MSETSIHIKTFGCQMNVYDSDRMTSVLKGQGYRFEPELAKAEVILLNTCAIRDKAEHKVLSLLGELKPLKEKMPGRVIGVTGCVAQRMGRNLLQRVPHLDLVMGPDSIDRVGELVREVRESGRRVLETKLDTDGRSYSQPAIVESGKVSELLTIMKGCDHFCTYCIVPFVRGREKSRSVAEIVTDVEKLVARGTREVIFLGQNINTYGKGTGETLAQLIEATNRVEGLERIRYVTSHPRDLGQDLIDQFGTVEKLCPQLHLPFQSGSNAVLKRMSRLYTRELYLEKIAKLREARPDIAISGDVIVGFPDETDAEFEETLSLMHEVRPTSLFIFKYSPRPGTRAFALGDTVPELVKAERLSRAQKVAFEYTAQANRLLVGTRQKVLIENLDKKGLNYFGRTPHNEGVHVEGAGPACLGKTIEVEILESNKDNLKGIYVGSGHHCLHRAEGALSAQV